MPKNLCGRLVKKFDVDDVVTVLYAQVLVQYLCPIKIATNVAEGHNLPNNWAILLKNFTETVFNIIKLSMYAFYHRFVKTQRKTANLCAHFLSRCLRISL